MLSFAAAAVLLPVLALLVSTLAFASSGRRAAARLHRDPTLIALQHASAILTALVLLLPVSPAPCWAYLHLFSLFFPLWTYLGLWRVVRYVWRRYREVGRVLAMQNDARRARRQRFPSIVDGGTGETLMDSSADAPRRRAASVARPALTTTTFHTTANANANNADSPTEGRMGLGYASHRSAFETDAGNHTVHRAISKDSSQDSATLMHSFPRPPPQQLSATAASRARSSSRLSITSFRRFVDATFRPVNTATTMLTLPELRKSPVDCDAYEVCFPGVNSTLAFRALEWQPVGFFTQYWHVLMIASLLIGLQAVAALVESNSSAFTSTPLEGVSACVTTWEMAPVAVATIIPVLVMAGPLMYLAAAVPGKDGLCITEEIAASGAAVLVGVIGVSVQATVGLAGAELSLVSMQVAVQIVSAASLWRASKRLPERMSEENMDPSAMQDIEAARNEAFRVVLDNRYSLCDIKLFCISRFSISRLFLRMDLARIDRAFQCLLDITPPLVEPKTILQPPSHVPWRRRQSANVIATAAAPTQDTLARLDVLQRLLRIVHHRYLHKQARFAVGESDLSAETHLRLNRLAIMDPRAGTNEDVHWWLRVCDGGDFVVRDIIRLSIDELDRRMRMEYRHWGMPSSVMSIA